MFIPSHITDTSITQRMYRLYVQLLKLCSRELQLLGRLRVAGRSSGRCCFELVVFVLQLLIECGYLSQIFHEGVVLIPNLIQLGLLSCQHDGQYRGGWRHLVLFNHGLYVLCFLALCHGLGAGDIESGCVV